MKLILAEKIVKRTDLLYEQVISNISSGISNELKLFPDKIMRGRIEDGEIKSVINPPSGWSDPFRSRVKGIVKQVNGHIKIELTIRPGWVIIGFYLIWYWLMLRVIYDQIFEGTNSGIQLYLILIIYILFPLALGKLKVYWDRRRLESWLNGKI
jgi:hypothetical protein